MISPQPEQYQAGILWPPLEIGVRRGIGDRLESDRHWQGRLVWIVEKAGEIGDRRCSLDPIDRGNPGRELCSLHGLQRPEGKADHVCVASLQGGGDGL